MTEQDKAYEINELTHRLKAAQIHLGKVEYGALQGSIELARLRIKEFEDRIVGII